MAELILYAVTFVVFLGIDFLGLGVVVKPVFDKHIPEMLRASPRIGPALAFYAFYIFGLVWFVSAPAMAEGQGLIWVAGNAAILAGIGFGTYEFTSLAVIKGWRWEMVLVDLCWGVAMTCVAAVSGVAVVGALFG